MSSKTIKYESSQHKAFKSELDKIGENFEDLITELKNVKSSVSDNLKGNAADSLNNVIEELLTELTTEKENWEVIGDNADKVEKLLKEADEQVSNTIDSNSAK